MEYLINLELDTSAESAPPLIITRVPLRQLLVAVHNVDRVINV